MAAATDGGGRIGPSVTTASKAMPPVRLEIFLNYGMIPLTFSFLTEDDLVKPQITANEIAVLDRIQQKLEERAVEAPTTSADPLSDLKVRGITTHGSSLFAADVIC